MKPVHLWFLLVYAGLLTVVILAGHQPVDPRFLEYTLLRYEAQEIPGSAFNSVAKMREYLESQGLEFAGESSVAWYYAPPTTRLRFIQMFDQQHQIEEWLNRILAQEHWGRQLPHFLLRWMWGNQELRIACQVQWQPDSAGELQKHYFSAIALIIPEGDGWTIYHNDSLWLATNQLSYNGRLWPLLAILTFIPILIGFAAYRPMIRIVRRLADKWCRVSA